MRFNAHGNRAGFGTKGSCATRLNVEAAARCFVNVCAVSAAQHWRSASNGCRFANCHRVARKAGMGRNTHRATRPTGNCSPALEDWLTAFFAVFPLPRPDMVALHDSSYGSVNIQRAAVMQANALLPQPFLSCEWLCCTGQHCSLAATTAKQLTRIQAVRCRPTVQA